MSVRNDDINDTSKLQLFQYCQKKKKQSNDEVHPIFQRSYQFHRSAKQLRVIFSERRESEDTHEKSIFLLFRQNIPLGELIQGKIV